MINWMTKKFIKNYDKVNDPKVREKYGNFAGIIGIISNLVLVVIKILLGILSGAVSIIADAINNLSDMATSIITIIGFKISSKPADDEHPFGHERLEYIMGLIISFIILWIGVELGRTSIDKIINPNPLDKTFIFVTLIGLFVAILIKIWQGTVYRKIAIKIDSVALKASSQDSFNDVISTSAVLIGLILSHFVFHFNLDGYLGVAVALFILYSGINLVKDTIDPLIGVTPDKELIQKISNDILNYEGVLGIHDLLCHMYGKTRCFISLHVEVSSKEDIIKSHDLIDNIEKEIKEKYNVEITIHLDPIEIDNEELNIARKELDVIISSIDKRLKYHDLRMVKGYTHTNLIFDVVKPFSFPLSVTKLKELIISKVQELHSDYMCVIVVEDSYIGEIE